MKFIVGAHQYDAKDANIFIGRNNDQCTITLANGDTDVDQMYEDISPIIKDGFSISEDEYTGYELDSIQKHYSEFEAGNIVVSLVKNKEEE